LPETGSELAGRTGHSPRIVSPASKEIVLASAKTVPLRAKVDGDVQKIYWFAGKTFIGQAGPNQFLGWEADAGDYEITALDDHGRAGSCSVIVH
jgi:penicillin-binding protein 1C